MKQGAVVCQIKASFSPPETDPLRYTRPKRALEPGRRMMLLRQIWTTLPEAGTINGLTSGELRERLRLHKRVSEHQL